MKKDVLVLSIKVEVNDYKFYIAYFNELVLSEREKREDIFKKRQSIHNFLRPWYIHTQSLFKNF